MSLILPVLARRPRSSGTDPTGVANLAVKLDPDTLALADAAAVTTWTDSASSLAFTQATAGQKPTLRTAQANGHKIVRFDGVDDNMAVTSSLLRVTSRTMFAVLKSSVADYTVNAAIIGLNGTNWYFGISTTENVLSNYVNSSAVNTPTSGLGGTGTIDTARYHIMSANVSTSGANVRTILRLDGALKQDRTLTTGHQAPASTTIRVGNTAGTPLGADVAMILVYTRSLTAAEQIGVGRWLAARFNLRYA